MRNQVVDKFHSEKAAEGIAKAIAAITEAGGTIHDGEITMPLEKPETLSQEKWEKANHACTFLFWGWHYVIFKK